ncbi:unnamed protein product [Acanthocheilonema viteae]|uniref:Uncharacterized protein n=1 Tax=Acanthocheilonema viteae TaxID=6277 RepID=A0A498SNK5_ACAVI|nr:unnamed protein product [Acanthocheilonema viteae]
MSYLPWLSLTWKMLRPVPVIKNFWSKEVERLRAACERFDGDTEKATDFCMPKLPLISIGEYKRALNLFLEQKPVFLHHLDIKQLQKRHEIEEENLIGYCTNGLIEAEFLKRMLSIHVSNFRKSMGAVNLRNITCIDWITVLIEYLKHLDGSSRKWHYSMKHVRELVSKKLGKKCGNVLASSSGNTVNGDENDSFSYSATSNRAPKDERKDYISYINGLEVNNINSQESIRNEEPISVNVYIEYFIEKLKKLIESRILLFDEQRQRKFTKKLRKIMKKDEKLESLQKLVEKMIFSLEDEQKMKLTKKYQKIMRRLQRMQLTESSESNIHCELNEVEMSGKNYGEGGEMENCTEYSGTIAEMTEETKQLGTDIDFGVLNSLKLQIKKKGGDSKGKSRQKREEMRAVRRNSISSEINKLAESIQKSESEAVDIVPLPKKSKGTKHGRKGDFNTMTSFLT